VLVAESWQERKKTHKGRKADAEALAAKNMRLVEQAKAAGTLPRLSDEVLARVRAAGKSPHDLQQVAAKSAPSLQKQVEKPSPIEAPLVKKAKSAKKKRKKLPPVNLKERDAEYRKALRLGAKDKLPAQLGNTTSGGGGRDRAKSARVAVTRKGPDVKLAKRARLIG
jgi:hypothetical protein